MLNPRHIYTLVLWLLLPYVLMRLVWRARKQPEYLRHVGERFGFYSIRSDSPLIWLHTVSVGETRAVQKLIGRLQAAYPEMRILLTHTTPTGRAASEQLYGDKVMRAYLPYDYPFAVERFLRHFSPRLGVLMETEIWVNLIYGCRKSDIPLLLLNARMSEKSARGYARFSRLTRASLGNLYGVGAQTAEDAARLEALGARNVTVAGNLKFDIEPPTELLNLGQRLRAQFGASRKVFLAASTRDGEEKLLLNALQHIDIPGLLLIIVPRHPQRFSEVGSLLKERSIAFVRRSEIGDLANDGPLHPLPSDVQAVLGDSMGEMFSYYAAADIAFIGGSLLPYGGQNLIESCAVGTPALVGLHTYNFAEATRLAIASGAAIRIQDECGLAAELQRLFSDPGALHEMQRQCRGFVEANRGATEGSLRLIGAALSAQPRRAE